ncbi:MAG: hypothetical protein JJU36_10715 [Phycisphaeraceae bacterium]|nr:hypothetical protein [Phycisphaeraceae bacterium]
MNQLDIVAFAWMTDEEDRARQDRASWWENRRSLLARYVRNLADGIDRTLTVPHRKVLLTNRMDWFGEFADRYLLLEMQPRFKRITNKFIAYDPAYPISERMILTDLDMVFIRNWDELADYDGPLIMNHTGGQRCWFRWSPGGGFIMTNRRTDLFERITRPLYEDAQAVYRRCRCRERYWFARQIGRRRIDYWQQRYPDAIGSFKKDIRRRARRISDFSILWFHGEPRPHNAPEVAHFWEPEPAAGGQDSIQPGG